MKILVLIANAAAAPGARPLDATRESNRILRRVPAHWDVRTVPRLQTDQLQVEIRRFGPDIIQLSGHCAEDGYFSIYDQLEAPREVSPEALARALIYACREHPPALFVLNACNTLKLGELLAPHADAVLAVTDALSDATAIPFPANFYELLAQAGMSLTSAFEEACNIINLEYEGGDVYRLLPGRGRERSALASLVYSEQSHEVSEGQLTIPPPSDKQRLERYYEPYALRDRSGDDSASLFCDSIRWWMTKARLNKPTLPLVCHREHVDLHTFWPGWDLSIVLLEQGGLEFLADGVTNRLSIDLGTSRHGIYSNAGKQFLLQTYLTSQGQRESVRALAEELHAAQLRREPIDMAWMFDEPYHVLRWASGGYIPIVRHDDRWWVMLFFRDIDPIGWNIANGASENQLERLRPDLLSRREATEEIVVLERRPARGRRVRAMRLDFGDAHGAADAQRLLRVHDEERKRRDLFTIVRDEATQTIPVRRLEGPTTIRVSDRDLVDAQETHGHFISVNPLALGVEATSIGVFDLPKGAYIIDGETLMNTNPDSFVVSHQLIRRPVGLFALDYLRKVMNDTGALGTGAWGEGRMLPEISGDRDFRLFDYDIEQRQVLHRREGDSHEETAWLERWGGPFRRAAEDGVLEDALRVLCPVTWRSLEIALTGLSDEDLVL